MGKFQRLIRHSGFAAILAAGLASCSSVEKSRSRNPASDEPPARQWLSKTFEYVEPMQEVFDRRVVLLPDGGILARVVSGRTSVVREFTSDGRLKSSFGVPRSFHDRDSLVRLDDGTIVVLTAKDKSLSFYSADGQPKARIPISATVDSLSEELIGLGNTVGVFAGRARSTAIALYDSNGASTGSIPLPEKAYAVHSAYSVIGKAEIAVPLIADSDGFRIFDSSGKLLKQVALKGSRYIPAPVVLENGNVIVQCDVDSICSYASDGSLRWRHDFPRGAFAGLPVAALPDEGVVCQTEGDGVYFFNSDGSMRAHLFAGQHLSAWGPAVVSPEGFVALFRWHEDSSQPGMVSYSYLFLDSQGNPVGEYKELLTAESMPVAVDGRTFVMADRDHLVGLRIAPP